MTRKVDKIMDNIRYQLRLKWESNFNRKFTDKVWNLFVASCINNINNYKDLKYKFALDEFVQYAAVLTKISDIGDLYRFKSEIEDVVIEAVDEIRKNYGNVIDKKRKMYGGTYAAFYKKSKRKL